MAKEQKNIKLFGVLADGTKAKAHQADKVVRFVNEKRSVVLKPDMSMVTTFKGSYKLTTCHTKNLYIGRTLTGVKIHAAKKKVVAQVIYWA